MRAARLIKMVLLLQSRSTMTAAELAKELDVSERTVVRDAQALSEAGVPVYAHRGRAGGYRLVGGYRTRLTGLARGEAEALFLSGVPGALREMGLEDAASAARLKVSAALLPALRDAPRTAAQRFHLDAPGWFREARTPPLLPVVADAVWDDRRITARYRRRPDHPGTSEVSRALEPYGLVLKAGVWYLCARAVPPPAPGAKAAAPAAPDTTEGPGTTGATDDPEAPDTADAPDAFRVYRVDRFTTVSPAEDRFVRDEAFDLSAFWEERAAAFARSILRATVVVRLSEDGARQLPHAVDRAAAQEALASAEAPDAHGRVTVVLPVESEDVAYAQLLALGPEAEVLRPAGLRDRLAGAAERMAALYR